MSGPFRIEKFGEVETTTLDGLQQSRGAQAAADFKNYMSRLVKLIPSEALGAYLTVRSFFIGSDGNVPSTGGVGMFVLSLPLLGLVLVAISRIWGTRDTGVAHPRPQWISVGISCIAFVLWIFAMGHEPPQLMIDGRIISALIVVFTFVVPYIYKGED